MTEIESLRAQIAALTMERDTFEMNLDSCASDCLRLYRICRDAYEVWAGSEGIPESMTCTEAYLLQLLIQMKNEVKKGLK